MGLNTRLPDFSVICGKRSVSFFIIALRALQRRTVAKLPGLLCNPSIAGIGLITHIVWVPSFEVPQI